MRMTEGPGRGGRASSLCPQRPPPFLCGTLTLSSPSHPGWRKPLQPGGIGKLEGEVVLAPPHSPRVTFLDYLCVVVRLWPSRWAILPSCPSPPSSIVHPFPPQLQNTFAPLLEKRDWRRDSRTEFSGGELKYRAGVDKRNPVSYHLGLLPLWHFL